jgi:hypothetical protein
LEVDEERDMMDSIAQFFNNVSWIHFVIVISMWLVVIGIIVFVYTAFSDITRKRSLEKFGLKSEVKGDNKEHIVDTVNDYLSGLISTSDGEVKEKLMAAGIYSETLAKVLIPLKYMSIVLAIFAVGVMTYLFQWKTQSGLVLGLVLVVIFLV